MSYYTTIRKQIKEFEVLITNDPQEMDKSHADFDLKRKNMLRVYGKTKTHWATLLISAEMLKEEIFDEFCYNNFNRQIAKLTS